MYNCFLESLFMLIIILVIIFDKRLNTKKLINNMKLVWSVKYHLF